MSPRNILVTGGSGQFGRYVLSELSSDYVVTNFDLIHNAQTSRNIEGDVLDLDAVTVAFENQDAVIHLAGIDAAINAPEKHIFLTNVQGTWNVLHAAEKLGIRKVILCSSVAVTGLSLASPKVTPMHLPVTEEHPLRPHSVYGLSKMLGEQIARAFSQRNNLTVTVLRPALIAFPSLIEEIDNKVRESDQENSSYSMSGESAASDLSILRAYVRPEDCARGFRRALETNAAPFSCFHLTANDTFTMAPTLKIIETQFGMLPDNINQMVFEKYPRASGFDNQRAKKLLHWSPEGVWSDLT